MVQKIQNETELCFYLLPTWYGFNGAPNLFYEPIRFPPPVGVPDNTTVGSKQKPPLWNTTAASKQKALNCWPQSNDLVWFPPKECLVTTDTNDQKQFAFAKLQNSQARGMNILPVSESCQNKMIVVCPASRGPPCPWQP